MATRVAVVVFPGSNCEFDTASALEDLGASSELVFHDATTLNGCDAVVIPGGFAHGDYLRPGAIARFSPVMAAVTEHAKAGGPVLGICNGFQVLTECGLLPGALQKNAGLKFRCETAQIRIETTSTSATRNGQVGQVLNIPINHFERTGSCSRTSRTPTDRWPILLAFVTTGATSSASCHTQSGRVTHCLVRPMAG